MNTFSFSIAELPLATQLPGAALTCVQAPGGFYKEKPLVSGPSSNCPLCWAKEGESTGSEEKMEMVVRTLGTESKLKWQD